MHSSQNSPSVSEYPGNPRILGQGGFCSYPRIVLQCPSILGIPGYLDKGGFEVCTHPRIVLQCPSILGIQGYLDKGGFEVCTHPRIYSPSVSKYPGNPGILGQGGEVCSSQGSPSVSEYPGNPGILGQGGF